MTLSDKIYELEPPPGSNRYYEAGYHDAASRASEIAEAAEVLVEAIRKIARGYSTGAYFVAKEALAEYERRIGK